MLTQRYSIDMVPGGVPLTLHVTQYDAGMTEFVFAPFTSSGAIDLSVVTTARIEATKPDRLAVVNNCTYADGEATYLLQKQLTAKEGAVWSKLVLLDANSNVIASKAIVWEVDRPGVTDGAAVSESDIPLLREAIDSASQAATYADRAQATYNNFAEVVADQVEQMQIHEGQTVIDGTLTVSGAAADAKVTGDRIRAIETALDSKAPVIINSASGDPVVVSDGADDMPMQSVAVNIEPLQSGSGDPSPDNVRPITGWAGAKVARTGKNLMPYPFSETTKTVAGITFTDLGDGKLKVNGTATARAVFFYANHVFKPIPSGDYILSRNTTVSNVVIAIDAYNGNTWVKNIKTSGLTESSFSIDYDGYDRLDIFVYISAGQTVSNDTISLMIRLATETDATFTTYSGQTYDITFPSEAGTVYGGTLDVTTGVLTVTNGYIAEYAGETLPSIWISDRNIYASGTIPTTGAQVVYKLATPVTYQLTPTEIRTLLGNNTLWADAGAVDVQYPADTKLYIDGKIAELQALVLENA